MQKVHRLRVCKGHYMRPLPMGPFPCWGWKWIPLALYSKNNNPLVWRAGSTGVIIQKRVHNSASRTQHEDVLKIDDKTFDTLHEYQTPVNWWIIKIKTHNCLDFSNRFHPKHWMLQTPEHRKLLCKLNSGSFLFFRICDRVFMLLQIFPKIKKDRVHFKS